MNNNKKGERGTKEFRAAELVVRLCVSLSLFVRARRERGLCACASRWVGKKIFFLLAGLGCRSRELDFRARGAVRNASCPGVVGVMASVIITGGWLPFFFSFFNVVWARFVGVMRVHVVSL